MSRIGLKFGDLTVISGSHKSVFCRCKCGAEDWYPSEISKPTYRHRRMCARCAGRPCEICGKWINAQAGRQSPTCSTECRKQRANQREKVRYQVVKNTSHWREVRQAQLSKMRLRIESDSDFAEIYRAYRRLNQQNHVDRINADPEKRTDYLKSKRDIAAAWRTRLHQDSEAHEAHKQAAREWYHALSQAEKDRIYYEPQRTRIIWKRTALDGRFFRDFLKLIDARKSNK